MRFVFDFDPEKCSACGACEIACMDQNDIDIENGMESYRKVSLYEKAGRQCYLSISCQHCIDAPCIQACHFSCLYKDEATGLTAYDNNSCIGCHACARVCPYHAPVFRPYPSASGKKPLEKMEKCHGCIERIKVGLEPACVHSCPTAALGWHWAD